MLNNDFQINHSDHLLRRQFSHNHLVGALRGMDSGMAIVLLDFLINKTRSAPFASKEGAVGIDDLARWIGAVIDAHPTTITNDGNEESLTDALQLVNDKSLTFFQILVFEILMIQSILSLSFFFYHTLPLTIYAEV